MAYRAISTDGRRARGALRGRYGDPVKTRREAVELAEAYRRISTSTATVPIRIIRVSAGRAEEGDS